MAASNKVSGVDLILLCDYLNQVVEIELKPWKSCRDSAPSRPSHLLAMFKPFITTLDRVYTMAKLLEVAKNSPDGQLLTACRDVEIPDIAVSVKVIYSHTAFTYGPLIDPGQSQQVLFSQPGALPQHERKKAVRIEIAIEIPEKDDPDEEERAEKIEALIAKES